MSATVRLKQLLFIVAALALVSLGLVAAVSTASPARADDTQTCEPSPEVNEGPTGFLTAPPDGRAWQIAETRTRPGTGTSATSERINYAWTGGPSDTHPVDSEFWQPNQGEHNGAPHNQPDGVPYQVGGGNSPWFLWKTVTTPGIPAVIEHTYTLHIDAVTCPDPAPETCPEGTDNAGEEIPAGQTEEEFCDDPEVDDGKKVVVCKYVGPPPGTPDHIIVVSVNSLDNFPENPVFPLTFGDAQDSIAIRFAVGNEQPGDEELVNCPVEEEPEVCPEGTDNAGEEIPEGQTEEEFCDEKPDPGPDTCPQGTDNAGQEIPEGESEEEFCDDDDEEEVCPDGTDKAGQEIPGGKSEQEFCDEDDQEDVCPEGTDNEGQTIPGGKSEQEFCDDDNPPVVVPDDGTTPDSGPTVKGAQATAPTAVAGAAAGTPAAQVPTAVNAGLAPEELAGNGGTMGLLGIAAALLGAALVGLTFRPKRRIGAALHART